MVKASYHFTTPPELVAARVTDAAPHEVAGVLAVIVGFGVTVIRIGVVK